MRFSVKPGTTSNYNAVMKWNGSNYILSQDLSGFSTNDSNNIIGGYGQFTYDGYGTKQIKSTTSTYCLSTTSTNALSFQTCGILPGTFTQGWNLYPDYSGNYYAYQTKAGLNYFLSSSTTFSTLSVKSSNYLPSESLFTIS
jgi:hypothetical protein